jgi:hypothetical protein
MLQQWSTMESCAASSEAFRWNEKYIMTNTRVVTSIFGAKQPKVKDRKEMTYVCKLECKVMTEVWNGGGEGVVVVVDAINVFKLTSLRQTGTRSVNRFFLHAICFATPRDIKIRLIREIV